MEIRFFDEKTPSDKTEKNVRDIFRTAGQIMFNYYRLVLKKNMPPEGKEKYALKIEKE